MRTPVASKIAFAIAAATGRIEGSPEPLGATSGRLMRTTSIDSGASVMSRMGLSDPVDACHCAAIELDLLPQRAADALHDVALDGLGETVGIDDLAAVVGDCELARPNFAATPIDVDLGNDCNARAVTLLVGHAATGRRIPALVPARRWPRLPSGLFRRSLDDGDIARILHVPQSQLNWINLYGGSNFVDEGFAREVNLRSNRIPQMGAS